MGWARRLGRVCGIEIEDCACGGGQLTVLAGIEPPKIIAKSLAQLRCTAPEQYWTGLSLGARAAPLQSGLR